MAGSEELNDEVEVEVEGEGEDIDDMDDTDIIDDGDEDEDGDEDGEIILDLQDETVIDMITREYIGDEDEYYDDEDDEDIPVYDSSEVELIENTMFYMTPYEKTRLIGIRKRQLVRMAQPNVDVPTGIINISLLAEEELRQGKLPMSVKRTLPNGRTVRIPASQLIDISRPT